MARSVLDSPRTRRVTLYQMREVAGVFGKSGGDGLVACVLWMIAGAVRRLAASFGSAGRSTGRLRPTHSGARWRRGLAPIRNPKHETGMTNQLRNTKDEWRGVITDFADGADGSWRGAGLWCRDTYSRPLSVPVVGPRRTPMQETPRQTIRPDEQAPQRATPRPQKTSGTELNLMPLTSVPVPCPPHMHIYTAAQEPHHSTEYPQVVHWNNECSKP